MFSSETKGSGRKPSGLKGLSYRMTALFSGEVSKARRREVIVKARRVRTLARRVLLSAISRWTWLIVMIAIAVGAPSLGQEAASQIRAEAERLQQTLKDKTISFPEMPDAATSVGNGLKKVIQEQSAGRVYSSLEKLGQMTDFLYGARSVVDNTETVKSGFPAFEAEWEKVSSRVSAVGQQTREKNWGDAPVAVRALSETAQSVTVPLLEGARGFAVSTQPRDGLFNIGQAEGEAQFAIFCAKLRFARKGAAYPLRSLMPEIETLQEKANGAFQPPRSIDLHTLFMSLNSALKQARELDATKSYAGALYQYLYAVGYFGMLDAAPPNSSQQSTLKGDLAAARQKLDGSKRDDSIAELFLQKAEAQVTRVDGSAPSMDDWKIAKVIIDQVLPAYFAVDKPLVARERASGKTIDVTLVRWPYT